MLEDIGYTGGSLLDPSCGSGTFLFTAINLLRKGGMNGAKLVEYVMNNIQEGRATVGRSPSSVVCRAGAAPPAFKDAI
jgi:hypothetical protein